MGGGMHGGGGGREWKCIIRTVYLYFIHINFLGQLGMYPTMVPIPPGSVTIGLKALDYFNFIMYVYFMHA